MMHVAIVLSWFSTLCFHGVYFSNFVSWSCNPFETYPAGNVLTPLFGQAFLNLADDGEYVFAGTFFVWRCLGLYWAEPLRSLGLFSISLAALSILGAFLHMHKLAQPRLGSGHVLSAAGLALLSWGGHLAHVCLPLQAMLAAGVATTRLPTASQLLAGPFPLRRLDVSEFINSWDGAVSTELILFHHVSIGILFLGAAGASGSLKGGGVPATTLRASIYTSSLFALAIALGCVGSISIVVCFALPCIPCYGAIASAYATVWGLFCHHYWIGILFLVGAASHSALGALRSTPYILAVLVSQRESVIGHLTWVCTFLGVHSVGPLIHNDSMQALGRHYDQLADGSIQVRPVVLAAVQSTLFGQCLELGFQSSPLGSVDYLVFHLESFCIHTTVLILLKGLLMSRSSRLVADKGALGFVYPCDGPGRGGTCQISPWDHVFLGTFWAYNTGAVGLFHSFWYAESFKWAQLDDWASSAGSVNGWLRSLLWTESAEVIQAYGSACAGYSLVFFTGHFVWALSLMFLFTGRGYWQELLESVSWAHVKLHLVPTIQPRALSITMGRAVGVTHYLAGAIGVSWAFSICRLVA